MLASPFSGNSSRNLPPEDGSDEQTVFPQQKALDIISRLHNSFFDHKPTQVCQELLLELITLTGSEGGFMGAMEKDYHDRPHLEVQAIINIHWHNNVQQYFGARPERGQHFTNMNTLFGKVLLEGVPVLSNHPDEDEPQYPAVFRSFLGIPLRHHGETIGLIGLINNPAGYQPDIVSLLQPVALTYGALLHSYRLRSGKESLELTNQQLFTELHTLTSSLDDIVFEVDERLICTRIWCNQQHLLFFPEEEIIGRCITNLIGEHAQAFRQLADTLLRTGESQYYEYADIRQEMPYWYALKMRLMPASVSSPRRILLFIQNITERKRNELELRQLNADYARNIQILDITQQMAHIGGWEFSLVTGQVFWTKQVYALREVPENFTPIYNDLVFYHPEDKHLLETAQRELLQQHQPYCVDLRHISAKGTVKWVRTSGIPVFTNDRVTGFRGIIMDIDQQKKAEMELENAARSRSEFLSIMSHEIRTPLNAIIGISGILQDQPGAQHPDLLQSLHFSANHLLGLVNDILDLSKIEAGKVALECTTVDLHDLIHGIAGNYQPLAAAKGLDLHTRIDPNIPQLVLGDAVRLGQILNNLVNNAVKFTHEGHISLELILEKAGGTYATIGFRITDTGIGIPPHLQAHIFDTFVQGDSANTREHGGTGLGLSITRKLVELMNSRITVVSEPQKGTTFQFSVDFRIPTTGTSPITQQAIDPANMLPGMRMLIVEDNKINRQVMQLQLNKTGAEVTLATNGREAVEKMKDQTFDGIMLDLHMPEMNGFETIPYIRNLQPHAFIVVLTADIMPDAMEQLQQLEVKDMLAKPYKAEDLYRILHRYKR
ncbi:ATP-binding protein [Chitinophaga qingshengii]|uniref:histidine kinase n=1 Tax=Chitinophaga qingshengii TaxID=1569794 RepID=A0ABR7TK59_9BACT|nr:ATP-binding protein [Chitinophaga qingshengii]MBC9929921.1 response regulator [Chitinophaga qingshengii]